MSHQFKAGDLALVIAGIFCGEVVEVMGWVTPGQIVESRKGDLFQLTAGSDSGWHVCSRGNEGIKAPHHLMPLRGDFAPEQQKTQAVPA